MMKTKGTLMLVKIRRKLYVQDDNPVTGLSIFDLNRDLICDLGNFTINPVLSVKAVRYDALDMESFEATCTKLLNKLN